MARQRGVKGNPTAFVQKYTHRCAWRFTREFSCPGELRRNPLHGRSRKRREPSGTEEEEERLFVGALAGGFVTTGRRTDSMYSCVCVSCGSNTITSRGSFFFLFPIVHQPTPWNPSRHERNTHRRVVVAYVVRLVFLSFFFLFFFFFFHP